MDNQIVIFVLLLVCFGLYIIIKKKKRNSSNLNLILEENLKSYMKDFDIKNEKKVRKQWLISLFIYSGISAVFAFIFIFFEIFINMGTIYGLLLALFFSFVSLASMFGIPYYYSYKKKGTAWLVWTMIFLPLGELKDLSKTEWNQILEWDALGWLFIIISLASQIYYWINCHRLYKVNAYRKEKQMLFLKESLNKDQKNISTPSEKINL